MHLQDSTKCGVFCNAKPTSFCNGIPWCSFLYDIPFYCMCNAVVFQAPDVCSVSFVHFLFVSCIGLLVAGVSSGHCGPVHNVANGATYARE